MVKLKIQVLAVLAVVIINISIAYGWFEYRDETIYLPPNTVRRLQSYPYRRGTSTRVRIVGAVGTTLSMVCSSINFARKCRRPRSSGCFDGRRSRPRTRRTGRCCGDFFYVGFDSNPFLTNAQRICGRWEGNRAITAISLPTTGQPVLVVGMSMPVIWVKF